jgi:predicted HTH transcriptional regulator
MKENLEQLLLSLVELPRETEYVEFKLNNSFHEEIGELVSALSNSANICNENFAYLVFGVDDSDHKILGTNFSPKKEKIGNEDFEPWLNKMLNPTINLSIFEFFYDNKNIVIFQIPACLDRPLSFKSQSYIRIGSYRKNLMQFPDKERIIWNNLKNKNFEKEIAIENITLDKVFNLIDFSRYFLLTKQTIPANRDSILLKLKEEGFVIEKMGNFGITNMGAILFATDLKKFENLKRKAVRVIVYNGKNRNETIREKEGILGYAIGFENLINYINDQLPSNEEIKKALRIENKMYPEIAIRELVANMLIHQDFSEKGTGPTVEIFSDRIEISNPGRPLIKTDRFIDHKPKSRNESIAAFMRRVGVCEERGSGIDKVVFNIELFQLPAPRFEDCDTYTLAILFAHQKISNMSREDKIRACYQHCCIKYVSNENLTNSSLRNRFDLSETKTSTAIVSNIITESVKAGLIKPFDPNSEAKKLAKYIPYWA